MDELKPEFWAQQWAAFWSAPAIMGPLLIVGFVVWWFRGTMFEREVAGSKAEISAVEQRLQLATERMAASERATEELEKQFQTYKEKVAIEGSKASPAKVDAAIVKVESSNTDIRSSLSAAIRDLDGFGALRKLDPKELKKLQDLGLGTNKVFGLTLNSIPDDVKKRD